MKIKPIIASMSLLAALLAGLFFLHGCGKGTKGTKGTKATPCCIDFDTTPSLAIGTSFGNPAFAPGATIFNGCSKKATIDNLVINGAPYFGFAKVVAAPTVFGSGKVLNLNNVTLLFTGNTSKVTLDFFDQGGTDNLSVNGAAHTGKLNAAPSSLGGVAVAVTSTTIGGQMKGTVTLTGAITSFRVGGQELLLDNICW